MRRLLDGPGGDDEPADRWRSPTTTSPSAGVPSASCSADEGLPRTRRSTRRSTTPRAPTRSSPTPTSAPRRSTGSARCAATTASRCPCSRPAASRMRDRRRRRRSPRAAAGRTASDTAGRTIVYCHNPARWLYQTDEYLGGPAWRSPLGPAAARPAPAPAPLGPPRRATRVDVYLANSRVVQRRIADDLRPRRRAAAAPARHGRLGAAGARAGARGLGARLRARRLPAAALQERRRRHRGRARHRPPARRRRARPRGGAAARDAARPRAPARRPQRRPAALGLRRCGRAGRRQPRGLRARPARGGGLRRARRSRCAAAASSRPSSRARPGCSSTSPSPTQIAAALAASDRHDWDPDTMRARAEEFGEARFIDRIRAIALGDEHRARVGKGGGLTMRPEGIRLLPWLVGAVDLLMIAGRDRARHPLPASRCRSSTPPATSCENTALASVFFVGDLAGHAGLLRHLRAARLRRRHRGVQARRQRLLLHRRARGDDGVPHAVPALPRLLRPALPDRRACCCCSAGC